MVSVDDDDDDEVVLRLPVYLREPDPEEPVCLFQYPLRPRWRPYNLAELRSARVRPAQRRVELQLGHECSEAHRDAGSASPLTSIALASTAMSAKTSYAIGMLRTDESGEPTAVCLTPLSATVQLRPSFAEIDQAEGAPATPAGDRASAEGTTADGAESEGGGEEAAGEEAEEGAASATLAPVFRAAQTEREIEARRSSYAYLVEQRDTEVWSKATLHPPDAAESLSVRERCFRPPE